MAIRRTPQQDAKIITAISIKWETLTDARAYGPFHGFTSFSDMVQKLVQREIYEDIEKRVMKK